MTTDHEAPNPLYSATSSESNSSASNGSAPSGSTSSGSLAEPAATPHRATTGEVWARRLFLVTFVLLSTLLGVFLIVLPWRPEWVENPLFSGYPWIKSVFASPFFRGICSGFGVLDLWIAISETAHYHEDL